MAEIDLNADLGEGAPYDEELLAIVSSANVACGGHAGDEATMAQTVRMAIANGVAVGAHPGYPDREGFGRESGYLHGDALYESLTEQVTALADIAAELGGSPAFMGMAGTELESAANAHGLDFIAEAFVDRAYEPDGTLVSRKEPGAVHKELSVATTQAVRLAEEGSATARNGEQVVVRADTLCIHGDTPGAAEKARAVRDVLESHGVTIRAKTLRG